jgi:hypothetical protein
MNKGNLESLTSVFSSPNLWWLLTTICLIVTFPIFTISASAQFLPPPPPPPVPPTLKNEHEELTSKETQFQLPKVFQPPQVQVITEELRDGKNVFKINITSEAPIKDCKITFTTSGDAKRTVDCVRDSGTVFKALIDAKQPYQTVYIQARDLYGDKSSTVEKLDVLPQLAIGEVIWNSLSSMIDTTKYIIQYIMVLMNSIHFL